MVPGNRKKTHESKYLSTLIERSGRTSTKLIGMVIFGEGNGIKGVAKEIFNSKLH